MGKGKWFRRSGRRSNNGTPGAAKGRRRSWLSGVANRCALSFETLEDRRVLANFLVLNSADLTNNATTLGSLRWAIEQANANDESDTIVFSDTVFEFSDTATIGLNGGPLNITANESLTILGPGSGKLTVAQTRNNQRVFVVNDGDENNAVGVEISGMTITGGNLVGLSEEQKGAGVHNSEALTMNEVVLDGNSASQGGGAVFVSRGRLTLNRSLVINNFGGGQLIAEDGDGGGAILNGRTDAMNSPTTTIINSTFADNFGAAIKNRNGVVNVQHSTITENDFGIVSWGNPLPDDPMNPPPPEEVFTRVYSSIVWGNGTDIERVGVNDDDPPVDLLPSITSLGFNIYETGNAADNTTPDGMYFELNASGMAMMPAPGDMPGVDPMFALDPITGFPLGLDDFGGSTMVFLLDPLSPAIDMGGPALSNFEQRGRHFVREFDFTNTGMPTSDIGAVEMQLATFVVDTLIDESNLIYSGIYMLEPGPSSPEIFPGGYEDPGNFSLREAIEFATKNPGLDTIIFSDALNTDFILDREDLNASPAPTIILTEGTLDINEDLIIQGPEGFILEIDGVGSDLNPLVQNGTGIRLFEINDGDSTTFSTITMSNLTLMGGDIVSQGGAIRSRENLDLFQMTFKNNNATADGGAIWIANGALATIDRSTFNNNRAANNGGAIFVAGGATLELTSSTISSNRAGNRGGGIYNNDAIVLVGYSTITLNEASSTRGSGIGVQGDSAAVDVRSTIVSGNVSNDVDFFGSTAAGAFTSSGFNLIGRGSALSAFDEPTDKTNILNPMLEPLARTGGFVETHAPTYRPDEGLISPVIDMGELIDPPPPPFPPGVPETDQRGEGFTRAFDIEGVGQAGVRIDIGAYELQGGVFEVSSLFDENDGVITAGNLSLREAIALANANPLFDVITFDAFITGLDDPTIFLSSFGLAPGTPRDIRITSSMRIEWGGTSQILINGGGLVDPLNPLFSSRMFTIDDGDLTKKIDVEFRGGDNVIQFYGASASEGGSVFYSRENLTLRDVVLHDTNTFDPDETLLGLPAIDQIVHGGALYQDGTGQAVKPTMLLERVRVTGAITDDVNADGGAIYAVNANLELIDSVITGNSTMMANSDGAGIALKNSTLTSTLSSITGNIAQAGTSDGGGIHSDNSVVILNETVVSGNHTAGANSQGGGLYGVNSNITFNDTVLTENDTLGSQSHGGGIYVTGATGVLTLNRSLLAENTTAGASAHGGGLALDGGTAVFDTTSIRLNSTTGNGSQGGGLWNNGGALIVRGSTVSGNQATHVQGRGGGIYSDTALSGSSITRIINSTVSGNSAPLRGGGVYNADGRVEILHSTITNNSVSTINTGAGVASFGNAGTTRTTVGSSIIAGNSGVSGGTRTDIDSVDSAFQNTFQSLGFNVIGTGNAIGAFTLAERGHLNPGLAPLADNGAPAGMFFVFETHEILEGSPAIDAGNPSFNPNSFSPPLAADQRGEIRVVGRIDAGAVESSFVPGIPADFDGDNDVDGRDFLSWQRNLGQSGASKAQGDADGNGLVNSQDLNVWKSNFGSSGGSSIAVAMAASSAALQAEGVGAAEESGFEPSADDVWTVGSLGTPAGVAASAEATAHYFEQPAGDSEASPAERLLWATDGYSLLEEESHLDSLAVEDPEDASAGDAVFAEWGAELL